MKGSLMDFYLVEDLMKGGAEWRNAKETKEETVHGDLLLSGQECCLFVAGLECIGN